MMSTVNPVCLDMYLFVNYNKFNCYIVTANVCFIQNGETPLMTASFEGHVDIVRILIEAQAQVNTQKEVCCYKITHHK